MPTLDTKIRKTRQQIADLKSHLKNLENQKLGINLKKPEFRAQQIPHTASVIVVFDGGTSCNNPKRGFGKGYGSYQISDGPITRVDFGMGHSCNSAEIRTMHSALKDVASSFEDCRNMHVHIMGDSQIALKWAKCCTKMQPSESCWKEFHTAVKMLREEVVKFGKITTQWHPREESVKLFGH